MKCDRKGKPGVLESACRLFPASSPDATALSTESRCFKKKPVTRPTEDMIPMMSSTLRGFWVEAIKLKTRGLFAMPYQNSAYTQLEDALPS